MPRGQHDHDFDERLEMEIIVDANGPEEQALGWYYYLEEHLHFPFRARCVAERPTSPLAVGDVVDIRGMPVEEVCAREMFVNIAWQKRLLAVPLSQLAGVAVDEGTRQAVEDWRTWVHRGYEL
jgi:hypothetical protein